MTPIKQSASNIEKAICVEMRGRTRDGHDRSQTREYDSRLVGTLRFDHVCGLTANMIQVGSKLVSFGLR
jgi:hypothetical protein